MGLCPVFNPGRRRGLLAFLCEEIIVAAVINIDMLRVKVMVSFAATPEEAHKEAVRFINCDIENCRNIEAFAIAHLRRGFLWFAPKAHRDRVFHECFHLTFRILKEIRAEGEDEELNAHLNEHINSKVLALFEKNALAGRQTEKGDRQ